MKYGVALTPTAEENLDQIYRFIAVRNLPAAQKFVAGIRTAITTLGRHPRRWPLAPEDGLDGMELRHLIHGNYRIIFVVASERVTILQIRHAARLPMD
jgi:plasmid stabilization system protein ParE